MLGSVAMSVGGHVCDCKHHIRTPCSTVSRLANHTKENTVDFNRCSGRWNSSWGSLRRGVFFQLAPIIGNWARLGRKGGNAEPRHRDPGHWIPWPEFTRRPAAAAAQLVKSKPGWPTPGIQTQTHGCLAPRDSVAVLTAGGSGSKSQ